MLARRFVSLPVVALASASVIVSTGAAPLAAATASTVPTPATTVTGIAKIRHVMIIMQENRSFDSYFRTYPGADGLAMRDGKPVACLPSTGSSCVRPFVDHDDRDGGAAHSAAAAKQAIDGGRMDGFLAVARNVVKCKTATDPNCGENAGAGPSRVMAYHTASDIPNYWAYAQNFVLEDRMFEPVASWSLASHLAMVSAWTANCSVPRDPMSCRSDLARPRPSPDIDAPYAWTDLTWLLARNHVSWAYYLDGGPRARGRGRRRAPGVPTIWNVLPQFADVRQDGQGGNVQSLTAFFAAAKPGRCRAWRGSRPICAIASIRRHSSRGGNRTSRASSTPSCGARSGRAPRSS